ncbi:hypothetical protein B0H10DRAFT_1967203 [Mycena sp. CBHHK59/15]|nr:hypothetical protein B0H10DRAFT_1967203 [Mycena sp. CBHHK59/15]
MLPRKVGRPKGVKDKPRPEGAPPRGRPRTRPLPESDSDDDGIKRPPKKRTRVSGMRQANTNNSPAPSRENPWVTPGASTSTTHPAHPNLSASTADEFEQYFDRDDFTVAAEQEIDRMEREALADQVPTASTSSAAHQALPVVKQLKNASQKSSSYAFFSKHEIFTHDADSEDNGEDSENEDDETVPRGAHSAAAEPSASMENGKAWFTQPKGMSMWLYHFFGDIVQPLLFQKRSGKLLRPPSFGNKNADTLGSFWIHPPEPVLTLEGYRFQPTLLYQPCIFLWLPHFFVAQLNCPKCWGALEKNGALRPRRITDSDSCFYIVSWVYYCRNGCKSHFHGWTCYASEISTKWVPPASCRIPAFGDFGDPQRYAGFVPSASYLTAMLNKAIERDEADAGQHTSCLAPDQVDVDDSHKIVKHIANEDGVPIFGALWTCMTSRYIRAQALTLTKSHEERIGPLMGITTSAKRYGLGEPVVAYSDDPIKDKGMLCTAFPSLGKDLTPMAAAHGLKSLSLPAELTVTLLDSAQLVQDAFTALIGPLDSDKSAHICASFDAEWNMSRQVGISILQIALHSRPNTIYIIPFHRFHKLPASLLRFLISKQVFLIGSAVQADLTRLKKQFNQLEDQTFNVIDLKQFAIQCGLIERRGSGSLDSLAEKLLGVYLSKDPSLRMNEEWEKAHIPPELINYAALDVFVSQLLFEKIAETAPLDCISAIQTPSFAGIRVKTQRNTRVLIDIDKVLIPSAAAILHVPSSSGARTKTKAGALTLSQLCSQSGSPTFQLVSPITLLQFDRCSQSVAENTIHTPSSQFTVSQPVARDIGTADADADENDVEEGADNNLADTESCADELLRTEMLEYTAEDEFDSSPLGRGLFNMLEKILDSPKEAQECYTRIKKNIFHAFHMIPLSSSHGLRAVFLRTLRDHMMRWDPAIWAQVDAKCRKVFKIGFDVMLLRNPRRIKRHTPCYVPPPSVLVPAIQHIFNVFGNAHDAELGVTVYDKVGVDKYGLNLYDSRRGTNDLEGGLHSDIYRKFGALHTAPRLTVNSLADHRTHYNLQAMAKHEFGVNWDYHHDLALINRTSFLLNYLSDIVDGADSYADWINGDLYERTTEKFGVCPFPESLRAQVDMEPYDENNAKKFKLNSNNDWLRRRQGLALPILPPTTPEGRKYFFSKIGDFAWNGMADGKTRFYVTADVLAAYSKSWDKTNNSRASQELIEAKMDLVRQTGKIFQSSNAPFPASLIGVASTSQPQRGVIETSPDDPSLPSSISVELVVSRPRITPSHPAPGEPLQTQRITTITEGNSSFASMSAAPQQLNRQPIQT